MKDEKKIHDEVDKSSLYYSFVIGCNLPLLCEKSGAIPLVLVSLMAGKQAGSQKKDWLI